MQWQQQSSAVQYTEIRQQHHWTKQTKQRHTFFIYLEWMHCCCGWWCVFYCSPRIRQFGCRLAVSRPPFGGCCFVQKVRNPEKHCATNRIGCSNNFRILRSVAGYYAQFLAQKTSSLPLRLGRISSQIGWRSSTQIARKQRNPIAVLRSKIHRTDNWPSGGMGILWWRDDCWSTNQNQWQVPNRSLLVYHGETKIFIFDKFVALHTEQQNIINSLKKSPEGGIERLSKVQLFYDGSRDPKSEK